MINLSPDQLRTFIAACEKGSFMGFRKIYSGTSKAHNLLLSAAWAEEEVLAYGGEIVTIYSKRL